MDQPLKFTDFFKKSVLQLSAFDKISIIDIVLSLSLAFLLGLFIYYVYYKSFRGVVYSHNYNVTFVLMTMITSLVIMTISTNIVLSLGMVGALSIVRFRTAVKDPMDIVYMFWAISVGITTGAHLYLLSIIGSAAIALVVYILSRRRLRNIAYLLIIHFLDEADEEIKIRLRRLNYKLKSKSVRQNKTELTVELRLADDNTSFVSELSALPGVQDVSLVHYSGDYAS